jgi:hypothetical protein
MAKKSQAKLVVDLAVLLDKYKIMVHKFKNNDFNLGKVPVLVLLELLISSEGQKFLEDCRK